MQDQNELKYVDEQQEPIPPRDSWATMTVNDLISVKYRLVDMMYAMRNNAAGKKMINNAVLYIDSLIH